MQAHFKPNGSILLRNERTGKQFVISTADERYLALVLQISGCKRNVLESGFTGIDPHGHKWQNGKQVKRDEEQPASSESLPVLEKSALAAIDKVSGWIGTGDDPGPIARASHWIHDKASAGFRMLPERVQQAVSLTLTGAFAGYTASQSIAERLAKERGCTPEQAATLRTVFAALDLAAFKATAGPLAAAGPIGVAASWTVPPVTAAYLVSASLSNPMAAYRVAKATIGDIIRAGKEKAGQVMESEEMPFGSIQELLEAFTGTVKDKLGREYHYVNGKRVANPNKKQVVQKPKAAKEDHSANAKGLLANAKKTGKLTATDARKLTETLKKMTVKDLKALQKEYGLTAKGKKEELVKGISQGLKNTTRGEIKTTERVKQQEEEKKKQQEALKYDGPLTRDGITAHLAKFNDPNLKASAAEGILKQHEKPAGSVKQHGMTESEEMQGTMVDGLNLKYTEKTRRAAAWTLANAVGSMPNALWRANKDIIHTEQTNAKDAIWAERYNMPGFMSAATGGNGNVVVYKGYGMEPGTFAHESGHNLATKFWEQTEPTENSKYGRAQLQEPPVSSYGSKSKSEDFAEACKLYADKEGRSILKAKFPKKFDALELLIGRMT